MEKPRHANGFTLTDLLIAIAIVLALAALTIGVAVEARKRSQEGPCIANLRQIGQAIELYRSDSGRMPERIQPLMATVSTPRIFKCPRDPFPEGYGSLAILCEAKSPAPNLSYVHCLDWKPVGEKLAEADPNHGLVTCLLHGKQVGPMPVGPPIDQTFCADLEGLYSRRLLRLRLDGSVQAGYRSTEVQRLPDGSMGRRISFWHLFTDVPFPN